MPDTKILADYLKKARKSAGKMSQQRLAERTGISRESVRMYESGERGPSDDNIPQLARALKVSEDELRDVVESYRQARADDPLPKRKEVYTAGNAGIVIRDEKTGRVWFAVEFPSYLIVENAMELVVRAEADLDEG